MGLAFIRGRLFDESLEPHLVESKGKKRALRLGSVCLPSQSLLSWLQESFSWPSGLHQFLQAPTVRLGLQAIPQVQVPKPAPVSSPRAPNNDSRQVGGGLAPFFCGSLVITLTTDRWVLDTVCHGYALKFRHLPRNRFLCVHRPSNTDKHLAIQQAIDHLINLGAVEPVPQAQQGTGVY